MTRGVPPHRLRPDDEAIDAIDGSDDVMPPPACHPPVTQAVAALPVTATSGVRQGQAAAHRPAAPAPRPRLPHQAGRAQLVYGYRSRPRLCMRHQVILCMWHQIILCI
jgi:hypothetical protein